MASEVTEQVAEQLEEAAEATRQIDTRALGYFFAGIGVGVAVGFIFGYRFNKEKIKAETLRESEEEIEQIREFYQQKLLAALPKPSVGELVEERGYSVKVEDEELIRPLRPTVPVREPSQETRPLSSLPRIFRTEIASKDKNEGWSFPQEMGRRSPDNPYIIHQDEYARNETDYTQVTYIYYAEDDILADEDETILHNRENLIGVGVLSRFGHGTDDYNILYIRNPLLELEIEICRSPGSYESEVLGLDPNEPPDAETT